MSNSVHLAWIKPAIRAACDPGPTRIPPPVPLQITDIQIQSDIAPHLPARMLLSDKQHKLWCVVSAASIETLQSRFPEFKPTDAMHLGKIVGAIILPQKTTLHLHPSLREFVLQVDSFQYLGGAGNNEFTESAKFHADDPEIAASIQKLRQIDLSSFMDRAKLEKQPAQAQPAGLSSAAATVAPPHPIADSFPFIPSLREQLATLAKDPHNVHIETDAFISADQVEQLRELENLSKPRPPPPAAASARAGLQASASEAQAATAAAKALTQPATGSQLDLDGCYGASQAYLSQDMYGCGSELQDFSERAYFSQRPERPPPISGAPATAAAAESTTGTVAAAGVSSGPQFSATHRFQTQHARAERFADGGGAPSAAQSIAAAQQQAKSQAFVAAFAGLPMSHTITHGSAEISTKPSSAAALAAATGQAIPILPPITAAAVAASVTKLAESKEESSKVTAPRSPAKSSVANAAAALSVPASPAGSRAPAARSPRRTPLPHSQRSPTKASPSRASASASPSRQSPPGGGAGNSASQPSYHNLPFDSLENPAQSAEQPPLSPQVEEIDEEEEAALARQESDFPFLTQAPVGTADNEEGEDASAAASQKSKQPVSDDGPVPMDLGTQPGEEPRALSATPVEGKKKGATKTPSPNSLRIPASPTPGSSAAASLTTSPQVPAAAPCAAAAAASSVAYGTAAIQARQAERERRVAAQLEAAEAARRLEEEAQRKREEEEAAAEEAKQLAKMRAEAEAEEARLAAIQEEREAEAARMAEAATAAASHQQATEDDEDVRIVAAGLAKDSPVNPRASRKRGLSAESKEADSTGKPAVAALSCNKKVRADGPLPGRTSGGGGGRREQPVPADVAEQVRRAMQALEAAEHSKSKQRGQQQLQLSATAPLTRSRRFELKLVPVTAGNVSVAAQEEESKEGEPVDVESHAAGKDSSTQFASPARGHQAATKKAQPAFAPFGALPVTTRQVESAVAYFRSLKKPHHASPSAPEQPETNSGDQDPQYSQWY